LVSLEDEKMKSDMKELKVSVELKADDYKYFAYHFNKRKFTILTVLYFILIDTNLYFLSLTGIRDAYLRAGISLLVSIVTSILVWFILFGTVSWKANRIYKSKNNLKQKQVYTFKDDGLYLASQTNNGRVKWSDIFKVEEGKNGFYIYIAKNRAFIIPKSAFGGGAYVEYFKGILKASIGNRARLS
jgi:hypothetical protein